MQINFKNQVALVTGAGGGLGRHYALALAQRGARVAVNDLAHVGDASGQTASAAHAVVAQIQATGGEAMVCHASVGDFTAVQAMVQQVIQAWGRVDILINNAGILRDKTFAKMNLADFEAVIQVNLMGAVHCAKALWPHMQAQNYGRIVMSTSASGLYGNFGQSNYSAAKLGLVGLMQTLAIEGAKNDIRVNGLAPSAATQMTKGILPEDVYAMLSPQAVVPAMLLLASAVAPTRTILCAGGGAFEAAHITLTQGVWLGSDEQTLERLAERWSQVVDRTGETVPESAAAQSYNEWSLASTAQAAKP